MARRWTAYLLGAIVMALLHGGAAEGRAELAYSKRAPEGLVGNGKLVVKVRPTSCEVHLGGTMKAHFRFFVNGVVQTDVASSQVNATFVPGGVIYAFPLGETRIEVMHGALADSPYFAAFRTVRGTQPIEVEVEQAGVPTFTVSKRIRVDGAQAKAPAMVSVGQPPSASSWNDLRTRVEAPYYTGLSVETPSAPLNLAIPFCRFLLDLGFDGRLHVCEMFRWRDVWSRDLGTGLAPGAMVSGRFSAAKTTIEYDLHRYEVANPKGLKVTEDPSQGGSAEGTAWLTRAVWQYYLLTGDTQFLKRSANILRPWVDAWIDRDASNEGLLVDVTEWMDHSRFFLFADGARVLYSNVLFAHLLDQFAAIDRTLGETEHARSLDVVHERFVRAINSRLWNEATGEYDNLQLWGKRDTRSSAAANALAVLCGVAPPERAVRALAAVRTLNWRPAGSTTITPPMTHVDINCDHNFKVWPWWNAVEARARFRNGDVGGGLYLLERCAATLKDEHYPGLIEELVSPDGATEGGHAFLSAAGSFLDAVRMGLFGIDILEAGCTRIRVEPHVPSDWKDWKAIVPLPHGELSVRQVDGKLRIGVTDPRVKTIEAPQGAIVEGARRAALSEPTRVVLGNDTSGPVPVKAPAPHLRKALVFSDPGMPSPKVMGLPGDHIGPDDLIRLDPAVTGALVVSGNGLPYTTRDNVNVQQALTKYLDNGGAVVFYGATMHDRHTMGETSGVVEWFVPRQQFHVVETISDWRFRASNEDPAVRREAEDGFTRGWEKTGCGEAGWIPARLPHSWQRQFGRQYWGWGWYRAHFHLARELQGRTLEVRLGRINDDDWTFVNGSLVGKRSGAELGRVYSIGPNDPAYKSLKFGGDNVIAVQVLGHGGNGGMFTDSATIGVETTRLGWSPLDPHVGVVTDRPRRFGVVSWGPGMFFNSWETSRGAFGFLIDGHDVDFEGKLGHLPRMKVPVKEAFTDFAVSRPWIFEPLAYTQTQRKLLVPDEGERYPCVARIVNRQTGGEFILIPASIASTPTGPKILKALKIEFTKRK